MVQILNIKLCSNSFTPTINNTYISIMGIAITVTILQRQKLGFEGIK